MKMTKSAITAAFAAAALAVLSGCATVIPCGLVYTSVTMPVSNATGSVAFNKKGEASCKSLFGLVAWGDASIKTAAENGKVAKVNTVDFKAENILGIYGTYTTIVSGDDAAAAVAAPAPLVPAPKAAGKKVAEPTAKKKAERTK